MRKPLFTLILAAFCGMSSAFAYDFSAVCSTGQTLYYNIIDAENHEVEMTHPNDNQYSPWNGYDAPSGNIELPSTVVYESVTYTVTSIGEKSFMWCGDLTGALVIPNTVTLIAEEAFSNCEGFGGDLIIPNSVRVIGNYAFNSCIGFDGELVIGEGVTSIGNAAFINCTGLTGNLVIPNSVSTMGRYAFSDCYGFFGNLILSNSLTSIEGNAFSGCVGLTGNLVIPNSVTSIGSFAFKNCRNLTGRLTLPNSVSYIGESAFYGCTGFTGNLVIPETVTQIGESAFRDCQGITSLTFKATNCSSMGSNSHPVFENCIALSSLTIGQNVSEIPEYAFYGCRYLTNGLVIPNSVIRIRKYAFYNCFGFTGELNIPNSVTRIDEFAFYNCHGFHGELIIPEEVFYIGSSAFYDCSGFTGDLIVPDAVATLGDNAFKNCSGFSGQLSIGKSMIQIGGGAFDHCHGISSVTFNAWHCSIMGSPTSPVFGNDSYFTSLTIGEKVQIIPDYAFYGCEMLLVSSITANGIIPPDIGEVALGNIRTYIPVYIPCGTKRAYQAAEMWNQFTNYQSEQDFPYHLTAISENEAFGTVNILQEPDCETDAIVEATPSEGCSFVAWSVDGEIVSAENPYTFTLTEDTEIVAVFSGMGVDDNEKMEIAAYPNPTTGLLVVEGEGIEKVEVYNAMGQLVLAKAVPDDRTEIDLSNAANGMYLVRMTGKDWAVEKNVVKR